MRSKVMRTIKSESY
uniref:Uncharacterized protein n=1 Tax=Lepeophtheirus salmonis TaxID=72036 RepID=A0A0K2UPT3_LEPSM